jgi:hypothetical protein
MALAYAGGIAVLGFRIAWFYIATHFAAYPAFGWDNMRYTLRVQEAMLGGDVSNGILTLPFAPAGIQHGGLEWFAGTLFGWTGFAGTSVVLLVTILIAPLTIPLVAALARRCGLNERHARIAGIVAFLVSLSPLERAVHYSWSIPFVAGTLLLLWRWWEQPRIKRAVCAGLMMGAAVHVHFFVWTMLWSAAGILVGSEVIADVHARRRSPILRTVLPFIVVSLLIAVPYFKDLLLFANNPLTAEAARHSSLILAREFESIPRSVALVIFAIATIAAFAPWRNPATRPLSACIAASVVVTHQQFVHGRILSYFTHYLPFLTFLFVITLATLLVQKKKSAVWMIALASTTLLTFGSAYEYADRYVLTPPGMWFAQTHLTAPIDVLRTDGMRQTVLTDFDSALTIAANTDDDVVFVPYLRHLLMSTREFAERYCLSEALAPGPTSAEWIGKELTEWSRAGQEQIMENRDRDLTIGREACAWVDAHLEEAFAKMGVTMILWNERNRPNWEIPETLFTKSASGDGWSLWKRV